MSTALTTEDDGYVMGIDEAGRGPVLSAMVYGCCLCPESKLPDLPSGLDDSKQLTAQKREELFRQLKEECSPWLLWGCDIIPADWLSARMMERNRYSLNEMSHDCAMQMIQRALDRGLRLKRVYLDTVGTESTYTRKLQARFSGRGIDFIVESKADANYAIVSAASICAKVTRDRVLDEHVFIERQMNVIGDVSKSDDISNEDSKINENDENGKNAIDHSVNNFGNGYPSDEITKKWLRDHTDPVFGFPSIVRFSWQTAKSIIEERCVKVEFSDEKADNALTKFGFGVKKVTSDGEKEFLPRALYFRQSGLSSVCTERCPF